VPAAIIPAAIDESVKKGELPRAHALRLALEKARMVREKIGGEGRESFILAADTVVACGRRILPKAEDDAAVRACLTLLSGRRHQVITAVALRTPSGKTLSRAVLTRVSFVRLSPREIDAYVDCREGIGKAGGYAIQGRAEMLVKDISGSYSNVVGLPLAETVRLLAGNGFVLP
jgi:septum formation protein